jgi:hypothetical protein
MLNSQIEHGMHKGTGGDLTVLSSKAGTYSRIHRYASYSINTATPSSLAAPFLLPV